MKIISDIGIQIPQVYLPKPGVDPHKWAVIACDQFIYTEIFKGKGSESSAPERQKLTGAQLRKDAQLVALVRAAIDAASGEDGRVRLSIVGGSIQKQAPDFDSRRYGYAKLSDLIEAIGLFTLTREGGTIVVSDEKPKRGR